MVKNKKFQETQNLLENYNMMNTVRFPTRITPCIEYLIDIIIIYKDNPILSKAVIDLGFSDHLTQIVGINSGRKK